MVITYYGNSYFKLTLGDLTVAINPPSKSKKPSRFGADLALITTNIPEGNDPETVTLGEKVPFVIDGPGSYESNGLFITGVQTNVTIGKEQYINTVYGFELDNIKIGIIGYVPDENSLSKDAKQVLANADMIFVPVGEPGPDAAVAYKLATAFDPNIIIPYGDDTAALKHFLKEGGQEKNEVQEKATLKRKDLDGKEGQIIVLANAS